ncbi:MAG TPA: LysM domain-containing protein [Rhodocyclaceae bacterium]
MHRIIAALSGALLALTPGFASAQSAAAETVVETRGNVLQLAPDAPDRYVVVKGDTLWGISSRYLLSPWNWPELWGMNLEEVRNPHLIYPGDVLVLDRQAKRLYLERNGKLVDTGREPSTDARLSPQVHVVDNRGAIPSIPADALQPFLTTPLIVEANELAGAPRVIGAQENRVVLGSGDRVFVGGLPGTDQLEWHFYRPGDPLRDPDTGEVLGHEAIYLGDGTLERTGDPALLLIKRAKLEIGQGDRLITAKRALVTNYLPRRPPSGFSGKVAAIHGKGTIGGQYSVITLNRGRQSGLEIGHVVALERAGRIVGVRSEDRGFEQVELPSDRYALAFVFRTFDRIAYALVLHATVQISIGDVARAP